MALYSACRGQQKLKNRPLHVGFSSLMAVLMKIQIFWNFTCWLVNS